MIPLVVFLSATAVVLAGAWVRQRSLRAAWPPALRGGLAVMLTLTGISHFVGLREELIAMVPPALPAPEVLVTVTGVLELAAVAGLLVTRTAAWAAGGLVLLFVAMFPANIHAAASGGTLAGEPATALGARAAIQVLYVAAAGSVVMATRRRAVRPTDLLLAARRAPVSPPRALGPAAGEPVGVVVVTRLTLRSLRHVPGFLAASLRLRRGLRRAPGAVWLDLTAQPLARTFWTTSAWTEEAAMRRYVRSPEHADVMHRHGPSLQDSDFRPVAPAHAPRNWTDAQRLLDRDHDHVVTA